MQSTKTETRPVLRSVEERTDVDTALGHAQQPEMEAVSALGASSSPSVAAFDAVPPFGSSLFLLGDG